MSLSRVLPTALAALLVTAAPASAADWTAEGLITPAEQSVGNLQASVDSGGDALFAWNAGSFAAPNPLLFRARPRNGPFGDVGQIPAAPGGLPDFAASRANSDAAIAWTERRDEQTFNYPVVKAAVRKGDGGFGRPQTIVDAGSGATICWWEVAVADTGEAILSYGVGEEMRGFTSCRSFIATRVPGGDGFGAPAELPGGVVGDRPVIAFDSRGNALIAWRGENLTAVQVARYTAGGNVTPPQAVAVPGEVVPRFDGPLVLRVSEPTGRAVLGFPSSANGGQGVHVAASVGTVTNGFAEPQVLSGPADLSSGQLGAYFDGDAGDHGTLALAWRSSGRGRTRTQVAYVNGNETDLTVDRTTSVSGYSVQTPRIVVTPNGRVTVSWLRLVGDGARRLEASSANGGRFSRAQIVSGPRVDSRPQPVLEVNSRGEQFLVWSRSERNRGNHFVVESAKASSRTGRFGGTLDVLRARTSIGETAGDFIVLPGATRDGSMYAAVRRDRRSGGAYWDLRSYGEK